MKTANRMAFKEWAVVCAALEQGRQTLILRKGGIHEGQGGFQVEHPEFWLFPTYLHQDAGALVEETRPLLEQVQGARPPQGQVRISHYVVVADPIEVHDPALLVALAGQHIWSHRTVDARFHYKRPGLFVLPVRVYRLRRPFELPNSPHFAGCRSWVDLPDALPTAGAEPILDHAEFARRICLIRSALSIVRLA